MSSTCVKYAVMARARYTQICSQNYAKMRGVLFTVIGGRQEGRGIYIIYIAVGKRRIATIKYLRARVTLYSTPDGTNVFISAFFRENSCSL